MRWFTSETPKTPVAEPQQLDQVSGVHTSLALNVLYHRLLPGEKHHILDLGPPLKANIDFFSQFPCRLYIEDLYSTLSSFDYLSPEDGFSHEAVFEYLLPFQKNVRFDIILSWDLVNYLERDESSQLVQHLSRFCRKGSQLLVLVSTLKHISEKPIRFRIVDSQSLDYESESAVLKPCPRYQQTDLNQMMPHFRVANSFLLRNGFKEYIFTLD